MSAIALENKTILVTGAAGFIGSNLVKRICEEVPSAKVVGIDSVNDYYDVALKEFRLNELSKYESFTFIKGNIANKELITEIFTKYKPAVVVNLAAQAGVRYSITNPDAETGKMLVCVNPQWFRPTDVDNLWGDPTKAKTVLGWNPQKTSYEELVEIMAKHDRTLAKKEAAMKNA